MYEPMTRKNRKSLLSDCFYVRERDGLSGIFQPPKLYDAGKLVDSGKLQQYWNRNEYVLKEFTASKPFDRAVQTIPEAFISYFGLRSVEFGRWMEEDDKAQFLYAASDAFYKMAKLLKVPEKFLSLNGTLSISLGARGSGRAAAHYEPGRKIINITKPHIRVGALAHEFGHALDDALGNHTGGSKTRMTADKNGLNESGFKGAFENFFNNLYWKNSSKKEKTEFGESLSERVEGEYTHTEYLRSRNEVWARSSEIYISTLLHKAGIDFNQMLVGSKGSYNVAYYPSDKDLEPCIDIMDYIYSQGLKFANGQTATEFKPTIRKESELDRTEAKKDKPKAKKQDNGKWTKHEQEKDKEKVLDTLIKIAYTPIGEIEKATGLSLAKLSVILLELEFMDIVEQRPNHKGKSFRLSEDKPEPKARTKKKEPNTKYSTLRLYEKFLYLLDEPLLSFSGSEIEGFIDTKKMIKVEAYIEEFQDKTVDDLDFFDENGGIELTKLFFNKAYGIIEYPGLGLENVLRSAYRQKKKVLDSAKEAIDKIVNNLKNGKSEDNDQTYKRVSERITEYYLAKFFMYKQIASYPENAQKTKKKSKADWSEPHGETVQALYKRFSDRIDKTLVTLTDEQLNKSVLTPEKRTSIEAALKEVISDFSKESQVFIKNKNIKTRVTDFVLEIVKKRIPYSGESSKEMYLNGIGQLLYYFRDVKKILRKYKSQIKSGKVGTAQPVYDGLLFHIARLYFIKHNYYDLLLTLPKTEEKRPIQRYTVGTALFGDSVDIDLQDETLTGRYALINIKDLLPSNNPTTFSASPGYPAVCQTRDYSKKSEQNKVARIANDFKPKHLINDSPTATTGSPIVSNVTEHGYPALGGNGRSMAMILRYQQHKFDEYTALLKKQCKNYGFSSEQQVSKDSVLVRLIDEEIKNCSAISNKLNADLRVESDSTTEAVGLAKQMDEDSYNKIAQYFELSGANTLREVLKQPKYRDGIIRTLKEQKIITSQNYSQWLNENTQAFTLSGQDKLESILLGAVLPNSKLIDKAKNYTGKIVKTLKSWIAMKALPSKWDLMPELKQSIELESDRRSKDMKRGDYLKQRDMFSSEIPIKVMMFWAMIEDNTAKLFKQKMESYIRTAQNESGDSMFGGEKLDQIEVLAKLSGLDNKSLNDSLMYRPDRIKEQKQLRDKPKRKRVMKKKKKSIFDNLVRFIKKDPIFKKKRK